MKKLFTLIAFLTCFLGAKAEVVVDAEINFADATEPSFVWSGLVEGASFDIEDGCLHYHSDAAGTNAWDTQFVLSGLGGVDVQIGLTYTIEMKIKGSVEGPWWNTSFAGQNKYGQYTVKTDWDVCTFVFEDVASTDNANPLLQCGSYVGDLWIESIKITHEQKEGQKEVQWKDFGVVNGDAENAWPDWALAETDGVNANWRGDRATEICAWSLTMGRNFDEGDNITTDSPRARPFPSDIEEEEGGNHVFAVHVTEIDVIDAPEPDANSIAWSNQFFFMLPKGIKAGTQLKVHFRYKASTSCTVPTQVHHQNPSWYLHYTGALGDINFTDEWQEYDKIVTIDGWSGNDLGYCFAFNLNNDATNARTAPIDFYFDDFSVQEMDLQEGLFVASANTAAGGTTDPDYAVEFTMEDDDYYVTTVGKAGDKDSWVDEVMISTVFGHKNTFLKNTLGLADNKTVSAETVETWMSYTESANTKIKLVPGVWQIEIDTNEKFMKFTQIEGEELKELEDVIVNASELAIEAAERKFKNADEAAEAGVELPEDYVANGQPWDNQFWIVANREFQPGEQTVVEFDYKLISDDVTEAKVSTQGHGDPGSYKGGGAGDITFKPEQDHFKGDFAIPEKDWQGNAITGVKSLAFNMAEIREACTYVIWNVKWYIKNSEEGRTTENLINETGTDNFWVKIGAGTDPYNWTTGPAPKKADPNINGDETINGQDLQALINAIVAESTDTAKFDITGDGIINGQDLQALINIIVAQE